MAIISAPAALRYWADKSPGSAALTIDELTLTRDELERRTNRLARAFLTLGVTEGSFVTIALPNCALYVECAIAALKLGATPQPVSGRLPKSELEAIIQLANPSLVVGASADDYPGLQVITGDFVADPALSDAPLPDKTAKHWKAPTSGGSTGRPKLIVSGSRAEIDIDAPAYALPFLLPRDGVVLLPGPLYHNGPFTFCLQALLRGDHVVLMRKFDAAQTLVLIEKFHVNATLLVPTMMSRIWKLPEQERTAPDLSSLRVVYHMASHCPEWLKQVWIDWLGPERIFELYAGTEMQAISIIEGQEWLEHRGSVGKCRIGEMKIVGADGADLGPGEVGEIYMRPAPGAPTTYFYLGAEAKRIGDWETLGDVGWFDVDGYLYLADRGSDLILRGGANIYPAEVEAALDEHPAVQSCAVVGLPEEDLGQSVHAIVQTRSPVTPEDLLAHLSSRLARYKVPTSFEFVTEALRDDAGKSRRSALRDARLSGARKP